MRRARGPRARGRGLARADERRRGAGAGRDPRHRRPPEVPRRRGRGAPAGPRRQPLRELRRAAHARPHGRRRRRRRLRPAGGAHAGRRGRRGHRPAPRRRRSTAQAPTANRVLAHPKITVRYGTVVEEILGEDTVSGVRARERGRRATRRTSSSAGCSSTSGSSPTASTCATCSTLDDDGRIPTDGALQTELAGVFAAGIVRRGSLGRRPSPPARARRRPRRRTATSAGSAGAGRRNRPRRLRPPEATEAHMAEKLTVHDPRGYPPKVTGKPLAPRLAEPRRQDALSRRLPVRQLRGLHRPAARMVRRAHAGRGDQRISSRARAGSTTRRCARRSRPTATPPSSAVGL